MYERRIVNIFSSQTTLLVGEGNTWSSLYIQMCVLGG